MTRGLVLFRDEKEPTAMRKSRTHFEQIPLEVVKKIAEETFPEKKTPALTR